MAYDENGRAYRPDVIHDPVVSNAIFRETLRKERKAFQIRDEYSLNPKAMNSVAPKPNLVIRGEMPLSMAKKQGLELQGMDAETIEQLSSILQAQFKPPKEKYAAPLTEQQEVGWLAETYAHRFRQRKQFGIKSNDITKYAEAYKITVGRSPFQQKPPIA